MTDQEDTTMDTNTTNDGCYIGLTRQQEDTMDTIETNEQAGPALSVAHRDAVNHASGIVNAAINNGLEHVLPPASRALWQAATPLLEDERDAVGVRLAYVLKLDALLAAPEVLVGMVADVRDTLVCCDPELRQVFERPAPDR